MARAPKTTETSSATTSAATVPATPAAKVPRAAKVPVSVKAKTAAIAEPEEVSATATPVAVAKPRAARAKKVEEPVQEVTAVSDAPASETPEVSTPAGPRARRVVTAESVDAEFTSILELVGSDSATSGDAKFIRNLRKRLDLLQKDSRRVTTPKRRNNSKPGNSQNSGILKPTLLSDEGCDFAGVAHGTLMSRVDFGKHIQKYIVENNLKSKENGREIVPNKVLTKLLRYSQKDCVDTSLDKNGNPKNPEGKLYYYVIQQLIQRHFTKATA